jgi:Lamin Tail Domain
MFAPSESNSEYIEICNISSTTINLSSFQIKYHTSTSDEIFSQVNEYNLQPNQFAVIFEADYDLTTGVYTELIPKDALVFILDDNAFGSSGMANTSDRTIYLISQSEDTLDVYTYSANNEKGYSDERIDNAESIWENSKLFNGTPGRKNSVTAVQYDLAIAEYYALPPFVVLGDSTVINIKIKNIGLEPTQSFNLKVYSDQNKDNQPQLEELIVTETYLELNTQDSLFVSITVGNLSKGENTFIAEIEYPLDEFLDNNSSSLVIKGIEINELRGDIVINEFMYTPKSPEPEWVEIFNLSEKIINLNKYQFADNSDTITITNHEIHFHPKEYLVIADDSSISNIYQNIENLIVTKLPTLNNSGDDLVILDSLNRVMDSLSYTPNMGGDNGGSLERVDAFSNSVDSYNWSESVFPTPGAINSVAQKDFDLFLDTVFTNPNHPLIGTNTKFDVKVTNVGKNPIDFSIVLYSDVNQDSLADDLLETSNLISLISGNSVQHEFSFEASVIASESHYIIKLKANDDDTTNNNFVFKLAPSYPKNSIVINEIMYSPTNYEPEWIELFNNSEYNINISDWSIGDVLTNPVFKKIHEEYIFPNKSYMVISKKNSIYNFHRNINSYVLELPFANLNNDEDGLVLKDCNNQIIDSLKYKNDWGGSGGRSLEKINLEFSSTNQNNWNSSIDLEGSTPGRINSLTPKDYDLAIMSLSTIPKYPIEGDSIKILVKIHNYGNMEAENFSIDLINNALIEDQILESQNNLFLPAGDSIVITSNKSIIIRDTIIISANITFELDQDIGNNFVDETIIPGFNKNAVLINEIMFKPNSGEPEWIEIVNKSDSIVNIRNWLIGDLSSRSIITQDEIELTPNEYLVISDYHSQLYFSSDIKVIQTELPNLNDTKDAIIIYDFRNAVIDSTYFNVTSNYNSANSLERVSLELPSTDYSNWTFSLDENKCTPGKVNSISTLPNYFFDDIIITEIMFDPSESNSEFLELLNNSDKQIEIGGWKIEDEDGDYFNIIEKSFLLEKNDFFVVAADSSVLQNYNWLENNDQLSILNLSSLNFTNTDKLFYLKDIKGNIIDSIHYSSSWHNSALLETKNTSLELINYNLVRTKSSNWSSSVSELGATPGIENSINVENMVSEAKLEITPNPFSPDNDGFEDFSFINYNLTQPVSQIRIRIYDSKGRFVRSLANNRSIGSQGTIIFDGLDKNKNPLKIGIYVILFEAVNSNNAVVDVIKDVVVVARKL